MLYSNVLGGIRAADPQLMEMARVFRIPAGRSIRYVYLPQVMPYFLSACGSALGLCWKSGIAAEVIGMPEAPSASSSSRPRSIWIPRICLPGRW